MKIRDLKESLPPHLARHVDSRGDKVDGDWEDGDWKPKKRRVLHKRMGTIQKSKDVTPKGYGPDESLEEGRLDDFIKVSKREFYDLEKQGAISNPQTGGLYMNNKLVGYRDNAGDGEQNFYDYFLDPDFVEELVAEGFWSDGKYNTTGTTHYLLVPHDGRPDYSKWSVMPYQDRPGSNPLHLKAMIDEYAKRLGWDRSDVVASWRGDLDQELASATEKLASDKKLIPSYEMDLQKTVKDLSQAKEVMKSGEEVKPANTEARDPQSVIKQFLDKKKSRQARSDELAKNPRKVNQLKSDKELQEEPTDSDYAIGMAQAKKSTGDRKPLRKSTIKKGHKIARAVAKEEQDLTEYKPGVTVLTREISFNDYEGHNGEQDYQTVKRIRWPYGIDVSFNDRARTVRFKTAKMKTVAKILDKHIDFGAVSAGEVLDLPPELMMDSTPTKKVTPGRKAARLLQANGWDVPFVDKGKNGYSLKIFGYKFRPSNPEHQKQAEARILDEKRQLESLLAKDFPNAQVKVVRSWIGRTESERRSKTIGEYNIRILVPFETAPIGDSPELMGESDRKSELKKKFRQDRDDEEVRTGKANKVGNMTVYDRNPPQDSLAGGIKSRMKNMKEAMPTTGTKITIAVNNKPVRELKLPRNARAHHVVQELRGLKLGLGEYEMQDAARKLAAGKVFKKDNISMTPAATHPREMESVEEDDSLNENPWNQAGQKKPTGGTLPPPKRGQVPSHNKMWQVGDKVIPHTGPLAGKPHIVVSSRKTSVNIVPRRGSYPDPYGMSVRAKHSWLTPAEVKEDDDPCWDGYEQIGMKKKGGKKVPNCVPKK